MHPIKTAKFAELKDELNVPGDPTVMFQLCEHLDLDSFIRKVRANELGEHDIWTMAAKKELKFIFADHVVPLMMQSMHNPDPESVCRYTSFMNWIFFQVYKPHEEN